MLLPFFTLAMIAPQRQRSLRAATTAHVALLGAALAGVALGATRSAPLIGQALLIAGIVEGALLVGWRLTQLPKSQALEFLLVSPLRPAGVLFAEALVGLCRLALVTLAGLPLLLVLIVLGVFVPGDLPALILLPWTWGAVAGLALTAWAYEPAGVRRWGERLAGVLLIAYLVVGILACEHLPVWLAGLPGNLGDVLLRGFRALHEQNPFATMQFALEAAPAWAGSRVAGMIVFGAALAALLLARAALRLHGHFHDEHYRPARLRAQRPRPPVGDRPLTWWAIKRVTRYAGRINLWLAGGFGIAYAVYVVAGDSWPVWLGRQVFRIADDMGGLPMLAAALTLLAAVPAAFQYGLWDSSAQDRCRRLELLLLTDLDGAAYWQAAAAAAWRRGRGYFAVALLLWLAAWYAGTLSGTQALAAAAAGVVLWSLYFALGFRAFARGVQASSLGLLLTVALPLACGLTAQAGWPLLARMLPPGSVYFGAASGPDVAWALGPLVTGLLALLIARRSLTRCENDLRRWYARHHGTTVLE